MNKIEIIINNKCWLESQAKEQLLEISKLKGIERIVGLPDLHAGKIPIGVAVKTKDVIYPHLIGGDIGCGMKLVKTGVVKKKFKMERWVKKLEKLKSLDEVKIESPYEGKSPIYPLGTIGKGNHFAEFQILNEVVDEEEFKKLNITKDDILLLIHSGSRNFGQNILDEFDFKEGLDPNGELGEKYLRNHEYALIWAERNRGLVADKILDYLGYNSIGESIIDCNHNFLEEEGYYYIHRKGATSSKKGAVIIPGSRGSLTYIVLPKEDTEISLNSLSHGAGRKWPRSMCKGKLQANYSREDIKTTALKSSVVCHDLELLYQETPKAYKNIDDVINSLLEFNLITVIATLKPLITFKG
ncbi:release factor H-coupled RctB family protein [Clostridium cavendishii DSM 21758]|uniref:3'-phosphate/5'-hydroxy nucleic acid ligase n=1 Tax=Clostridium cavendishii DSM 21758 TaxID=1121302 RepID=A0A1M6C9T6_9CLOT|nr:RNA ligase RtcB family protein [Clostridium cavendishii]SHI57785.1 release factor H-coupled RctB family protein [Clostridium cavendishii DSM 21758]